jgi:hypothetical protein
MEDPTIKMGAAKPDTGNQPTSPGMTPPGPAPAWGSPQSTGSEAGVQRPVEPAWQARSAGTPPSPAPANSATVLVGALQATPLFAWLVVTDAPGRPEMVGQIRPLTPTGFTTLGRAPGNDIILADRSCSAQHARVRLEEHAGGAACFFIYDQGSSNGLYVGARETYRNEESRVYRHALRDGEYIMIGETTLVFKQV